MLKNRKIWIFNSLALGTLFLLVACGDTSSSNNSSRYYLIGSECYDEKSNEIVSESLCFDSTNNSIFEKQRDGRCIFIDSGKEVEAEYCRRKISDIFAKQGQYCIDKIARVDVSDRFCDTSYLSRIRSDYNRYGDRYNNWDNNDHHRNDSRDHWGNSYSRVGFNNSSCRGRYAYNNNGRIGYINCGVDYDCRGLTLRDESTGRVVTCR